MRRNEILSIFGALVFVGGTMYALGKEAGIGATVCEVPAPKKLICDCTGNDERTTEDVVKSIQDDGVFK